MNSYPIRAISELTGVAATTLRAWERRYGLLKPARTPKGHRMYSSRDVDLVTEQVVIPVLATLGERWQYREAGIAEEHFFSVFLRNKLGARLHHEINRSSGNRIIVAGLPGEHHELGSLLFSMTAISHGYQVMYPVVSHRTGVSATLLSGTRAMQWNDDLEKQLANCIKTNSGPVLLGGEFSEKYREEIETVGAHVLGAEHADAVRKLEEIVPAFGEA